MKNICMSMVVLAVLNLLACSQEPEQSHIQMVDGYQLQADHILVKSIVGLVDARTKKAFCTGTLVHPELIVTAAHCVYGKTTKDYQLLFEQGSEEQRYQSPVKQQSFKKSHKYDSNFDIAWIRLEKQAPQPYKVMEVWNAPEDLEKGLELTMGGYGQEATHCSLGQKDCKGGNLKFSDTVMQEYVNRGRIHNLILVGPTPGKGPCFGDSGGPLAMEKSGKWYLLGNFMGWDKALVQEDSQKLCENGESIYNAVGSYVSWIEESSGLSLDFDKASNRRLAPKVSVSRVDLDQSSFIEWCMFDDIRSPSWYTTQTLIRKAADYAAEEDVGIKGRELFEDCHLAEYWIEKMLEQDASLSFTADQFAKGNFDFLLEDLRPLQALKAYGIKELALVNHGIADLSPIAHLKGLEKLVIMDNHPRSKKVGVLNLAPLTKLKHLVLYNPGLDFDGQELKNKTKLKYLKMAYTKVERWQQAAGLKLEELIVTEVDGFSLKGMDLSEVRNLELTAQLDLDISFPMKKLESLRIYETPLTKVFDFSLYPMMRQLHIQDSAIEELLNIEQAALLEEIFLMRNSNVHSIAGLANLPKLKSLEIVDGALSELLSINNCPQLEYISLRGNQLNSLPDMTRLEALKSIDLEDNAIESLLFTNSLPRVTQLNVSNNPLNGLDEMRQLPALEMLLLRNDKYKTIGSLDGLAELRSLKELNISHNQVEDLSPLLANKDLEVIIASHNLIQNYEALKALGKVEYFEGVGNPAEAVCPWEPSDRCRFEWFMLRI